MRQRFQVDECIRRFFTHVNANSLLQDPEGILASYIHMETGDTFRSNLPRLASLVTRPFQCFVLVPILYTGISIFLNVSGPGALFSYVRDPLCSVLQMVLLEFIRGKVRNSKGEIISDDMDDASTYELTEAMLTSACAVKLVEDGDAPEVQSMVDAKRSYECIVVFLVTVFYPIYLVIVFVIFVVPWSDEHKYKIKASGPVGNVLNAALWAFAQANAAFTILATMLYYAFCNQVLVQLVMMFKSACSNSILSGTNSPYASREEVICHYLYVQHCIERASRQWQCFLTTISVVLLFGSLFNAFKLITGSQDFITGFLFLSFSVFLLFLISVPVGVSSMCSGVRGSIERTGAASNEQVLYFG